MLLIITILNPYLEFQIYQPAVMVSPDACPEIKKNVKYTTAARVTKIFFSLRAYVRKRLF